LFKHMNMSFINVLFRKYIWLTQPQTWIIIQGRTFFAHPEWAVADMLCVHMCACEEKERFTDSSLWCPIKHNTLFLPFPRKTLMESRSRETHSPKHSLRTLLKFIDHFSLFCFSCSYPHTLATPLLPPVWPRFLTWHWLSRLCCYHQRFCFWKFVFKKVLQLPVNLTNGMCVFGPPSPLFFCSQVKISFLWQFVLLKAMGGKKTLWSLHNNTDSQYCTSRWTLSPMLQ